jgi:tetratricopeptide (TPR) repeat protein
LQKVLEYYEKSLEITRKTGDDSGEGAILNNNGLVYKFLGEYQKALEYFEKSLESDASLREIYAALCRNFLSLQCMIPHPEEIATPISKPMATAEIGLHHKTQPAEKFELKRYSPNPAAAPITPPIIYLIIQSLHTDSLLIMINSPARLSSGGKQNDEWLGQGKAAGSESHVSEV